MVMSENPLKQINLVRVNPRIYFLLSIVCTIAWSLILTCFIVEPQSITEILRESPYVLFILPLLVMGYSTFFISLDFSMSVMSECLRIIMESPPTKHSIKPGVGALVVIESACKYRQLVLLTKFQQFATLISTHINSNVEHNFTNQTQNIQSIFSKLNRSKNFARIIPQLKLSDTPNIA